MLTDLVQGVRVLHVTNRLGDHGGAEVSLLQALPSLQKLGVENAVQPLLASRPGVDVDPLRTSGVRLFSPPAGTSVLSRARAVRQAVRAFRPDVVHSSVWDADLIARLTTPRARERCVVGLINTMYSEEAFQASRSPRRLEVYRRVDALLVRRTRTFHALTRAVARDAERALGVPADRVVVVPRGRSRAELGEPSLERRARVRAALGLPDDAEVVLNVARQEPQKGMRDLVRAFAAIARSRPRVVLLQAGRPGAETDRFLACVRQSGVADRIHPLGRRNDVADLMAAADVFMLTSRWEGLGGVVLEAMALELPVVAHDVPAVREVLDGCGTLTPVGDSAALTRAVTDVFDRPEAAIARAHLGRLRFDEEFELSVVTSRMAQMYRSLTRAPETV